MAARKKIPIKTQVRLWTASGGRCEYEGCNKALWRDDLTMAEMNRAYIAHIVDVNPKTHRFDPVLSQQLDTEFSNLMLLCDQHHRLIDGELHEEYSTDRLQHMKQKHESRIEHLTSLKDERKSHVLLYGSNIGTHSAPVSWSGATTAMVPDRYPAEPHAIELGLKNSPAEDESVEYWEFEKQSLQKNYDRYLVPRLNSGEIKHLSVFALAPQPLLIMLGHLLSDIPAADVYQLHREPVGWVWPDDCDDVEFRFEQPSDIHQNAALNLSLSASINNERITAVLPQDNTSIWRITINRPHNDFLKSRNNLKAFRRVVRGAFDVIKAAHGQDALLHIFPAVPVSAAVEIGRVWMPKADLPLCVYDQNKKRGGFYQTLTLG